MGKKINVPVPSQTCYATPYDRLAQQTYKEYFKSCTEKVRKAQFQGNSIIQDP